MYDNGKSLRMGILVKDFNEQAANLLQIHNWKYEIEKSVDDGEYILVKIQKNSVIKKFAILYSQDTKKEVYSQIEREADACFINGLSFNKNCSFSRNFNKPLTTLNELLEVLKDWGFIHSQLLLDIILTFGEECNMVNGINIIQFVCNLL